MRSKSQPPWNKESKLKIIAMLKDGKPVKHLARELGISRWTLRHWRERYGSLSDGTAVDALGTVQPIEGLLPDPGTGPAGSALPAPASLLEQNIILRRELQEVSLERDILKRTLITIRDHSVKSLRPLG